MSKCSHLTLRPPELAAASVIPLKTVRAKYPHLVSQVDQVYLDRWTNHIKTASLGTDEVFETDGFTYTFVPMTYSQKRLCVRNSKAHTLGSFMSNHRVCSPACFHCIKDFQGPLNDDPPPISISPEARAAALS